MPVVVGDPGVASERAEIVDGPVHRLRDPDRLGLAGQVISPGSSSHQPVTNPPFRPDGPPPQMSLLDDDDPHRRRELAQPDRRPQARVAAAEDRDVGLRLPGERRRGEVGGELRPSVASASRSHNERRPPGRTPSSGSAAVEERGRLGSVTRAGYQPPASRTIRCSARAATTRR